MLGYALHEHQWEHWGINIQHIGNEIITYILCVILLLYSNFCDAEVRWSSGSFFISVFYVLLMFNLLVISLYSVKTSKLLLKRF